MTNLNAQADNCNVLTQYYNDFLKAQRDFEENLNNFQKVLDARKKYEDFLESLFKSPDGLKTIN